MQGIAGKGFILKVPERTPQIVWRVEKKREDRVKASLEAGREPDEEGTVILVVAGTMHQLNYVGGSIWQLCDGSRDLKAIAEALQQEFDVEPEELEDDVRVFVQDLVERGWLRYAE